MNKLKSLDTLKHLVEHYDGMKFEDLQEKVNHGELKFLIWVIWQILKEDENASNDL